MPKPTPSTVISTKDDIALCCEFLQIAQCSLVELADSLDRQRVASTLIDTIRAYAGQAYELRERLKAQL